MSPVNLHLLDFLATGDGAMALMVACLVFDHGLNGRIGGGRIGGGPLGGGPLCVDHTVLLASPD